MSKSNPQESNGDTGIKLTMEELSLNEFSKIHILRRVSLESVWGLLEHCPVEIVSSGATLIEKGQSNQSMYLVLDGRLSVHLDKPESEPIAFLEKGQTVGEISVIDDSTATAYVRAAVDTRLLKVDEDTFWRLVEVSHEFATNLLLMLATRLRANNSQIVEGVQKRMQLEHEASVDGLTGLRNRGWLDKNLDRMARRHKFGDHPFTVVMLDVDHFKRFNDDFGHAAGDSVLKAVAQTVMKKLRPTDMAARFGGEEFVVILPDTPLDGGLIAAGRLRQAVAETTVDCLDGRVLPAVTVSLGVALLSHDENGNEVLARADAALYKAKKNGRNRVESA